MAEVNTSCETTKMMRLTVKEKERETDRDSQVKRVLHKKPENRA